MSTTPATPNGSRPANGTRPPLPGSSIIGSVRYSLPELLNELKLERGAASFTMEKLHQTDIGKLFQNPQGQPKKRRVKNA